MIPDPKGAARLPHFTLSYKHRRRTYSIKRIDLVNGDIALRLVAGETKARRLLERQMDSVDVIGSFLLTDYDVGVECDAAWARATLVKARTRDVLAANGPLPEGC